MSLPLSAAWTRPARRPLESPKECLPSSTRFPLAVKPSERRARSSQEKSVTRVPGSIFFSLKRARACPSAKRRNSTPLLG